MRYNIRNLFLVILTIASVPTAPASAANQRTYDVGVAQADITPAYPIRLCGYAVRTHESEGVEQKLWAKALAIGADAEGPALLVTVDNCGVPASLVEQLCQRLAPAGVKRERLVLNSSHTHCGPCLSGALSNIFGKPIPPDQAATIDRYTRGLLDNLEKVCRAALADRKPATLAWSRGEVGFAANRRTKGGPVEHAMPALFVTGADGTLRAIVVNYACHGTTLPGDFNKVCGDWIGYAQQYAQEAHPGAIAMVTIGCSGDANPTPRGTLAQAQAYGRAIATEADRLLRGPLTPLTTPLKTAYNRIDLALDPIPSREQFQDLAKRNDAIGNNAKIQLAILDAGKPIASTLPYPIETWTFGDQLAMVFLAGEVVVDYDLRLKHDFDLSRLWVCGYSNDVPCYIPSRRILKEGGYEAEGAMTYYAKPTRLSPGTENDIIRAASGLIPESFRTPESRNEFPPPKSPQQALESWRTRDDMRVELVAAEPLVQSPVAIDFGPDGKLWVLEMIDYPEGLHENMTPGGRVKVLESTHHDGRYDKATIFLDHLTRPTGLMVWGDGALVCAAPDILLARDTRHTGKADIVTPLFTGFGPRNEQWLVNGLSLGLDGWVYGASSITNAPIHVVGNNATIELGNRDFRFRPDTLAFEPAAGRTQFCRVRDDWGNWFGNDNSNLLWNYPLPEHYARRNSHVTGPPAQVLVPRGYDVNQLYPASRILPRFNAPESAGRTTSACGPAIYRDDLLGPDFTGNAFVCEPVHDMVMRLTLAQRGATFTGRRSDDNQRSEFLASTDNWSRPVQVRTGPDGALWVVDMYRFVIEHPRWITPERLATLDTRAGADMGRIYRVYPKDKSPRQVPDLSNKSPAELATLLDTPSGTLRDMIQQEILRRSDKAAVPALQRVAHDAQSAARVQALWTLQGLGALTEPVVATALSDATPQGRANAVRLGEPFLNQSNQIASAVVAMANDSEPMVRYQVALSLGECKRTSAAEALARIAVSDGVNDAYFRAAVLTSATPFPVDLLTRVLSSAAPDGAGRTDLIAQLVATAAATADEKDLGRMIVSIAPPETGPVAGWHFQALARAVQPMEARGIDFFKFDDAPDPSVRAAIKRCVGLFDAARHVAGDPGAKDATRVAAINLMSSLPNADKDLDVLGTLLDPQTPAAVQKAAVSALGRQRGADAAKMVLARWPQASPGLRSSLLDLLLARPESTDALLAEIASGRVRPGEIPAAARARLLAAPNTARRARAQTLLAASHPSTRQQAIERFKRALSLKGDAAHGRALFAKTCTACHQLNGEGNSVGADLTALTDRSAPSLMTAILDPNAAVDGRFVGYVVELKDGRTLSGIIADETAAGLTVVQPNAVHDTVLRRDIARLRSTGLSLMPEGLEEGMTPQELADLIAYVAGASATREPSAH